MRAGPKLKGTVTQWEFENPHLVAIVVIVLVLWFS
jgi:hypothetical protein